MSQRRWRRHVVLGLVCALLGLWWQCQRGTAAAQWGSGPTDAENEAIRYSSGVPADAISSLQRRLDAGRTVLRFDAEHGYLKAVLRELHIPVASQVLVFSKTSFQRALISPAKPRAIYFRNDVYVGWVRGGPVLEIATVDPRLGAVFYTLNQEPAEKPRFQRQTQACLQCHDSASMTAGVPGLLMTSVQPDTDGEPMLAAGVLVTSDQSPFRERWGGWYVTGTHGSQFHRGNLMATRELGSARLDVTAGANVTDLRSRLDARPYLSRHSDIVALMVLEHESHVHNLMTRANYHTRMALAFDKARSVDVGQASVTVSEATQDSVRRVSEPLVRAMLFVDEVALTSPVSGTSGFARAFASQGPRDHAGRSLLDLDLTRRLLRYPCSYLIYSASFDALPTPVKDYIYGRLMEILTGKDVSQHFAHLTAADRTAILAVLLETKPDFVAWRAARLSRR